MSISPAARALVAASASSGRLRRREGSVMPVYGPQFVLIWICGPKAGACIGAKARWRVWIYFCPVLPKSLVPEEFVLDAAPAPFGGFELPVPLLRKGVPGVAEGRCRTDRLGGIIERSPLSRGGDCWPEGRLPERCSFHGGTGRSNPSPSRGASAANPISAGPGHRLDARAHEARGLTAPDGRAGRIRRRARRLLLKARDDAVARLR